MTKRSLRDGFKNSKGRHSLVVMTKWRCLLPFVPPVPGHTTARGFSPDSVSDPILISPRPHRSSSTTLVVTRNIVIIATTNECLLLYLVFDTWPIFTARNRPFFLKRSNLIPTNQSYNVLKSRNLCKPRLSQCPNFTCSSSGSNKRGSKWRASYHSRRTGFKSDHVTLKTPTRRIQQGMWIPISNFIGSILECCWCCGGRSLRFEDAHAPVPTRDTSRCITLMSVACP